MRKAIGDAMSNGDEASAAVIADLIVAGAPANSALANGWTCLHAAAFCGALALVKKLVVATTDATFRDWEGNLAVDLAATRRKDKQGGRFFAAPIVIPKETHNRAVCALSMYAEGDRRRHALR